MRAYYVVRFYDGLYYLRSWLPTADRKNASKLTRADAYCIAAETGGTVVRVTVHPRPKTAEVIGTIVRDLEYIAASTEGYDIQTGLHKAANHIRLLAEKNGWDSK